MPHYVNDDRGVRNIAPTFPGWVIVPKQAFVRRGDRVVAPFGEANNVPKNGVKLLELSWGKRWHSLGYSDRCRAYRPLNADAELEEPEAAPEPQVRKPKPPSPHARDYYPLAPRARAKIGDVFIRPGDTLASFLRGVYGHGSDRVLGNSGKTAAEIGDGVVLWREGKNPNPGSAPFWLPGNALYATPLPLP